MPETQHNVLYCSYQGQGKNGFEKKEKQLYSPLQRESLSYCKPFHGQHQEKYPHPHAARKTHFITLKTTMA
jgi:hypothetical protein